MNIYRVSTEFGFEGAGIDSALFSNESNALKYAKKLTDERRGIEDYYMCCVSVDKLTDDENGEFQFAETIICHEL